MFGSKLKADAKGTKSAGDAAYEKCYGSDKAGWKFNTACCAYARSATTCSKTPPSGPSPSPSPKPSPSPSPTLKSSVVV